ncbi:methyltransferase domain-containing protein, partial [bacterium]|nr:methyltransferase domain-containing protein [bacterium]
QIQVVSADESLKEAISSFFFDIGAEGVSETVDRGISQGICACFPRNKEAEVQTKINDYLNGLKEGFPSAVSLAWNYSAVPQDNWAEKYKEFYRAQKLTERFFLRPKWDSETTIPTDMFPIILDPGQAFGTGLHPSTKLSMKLIEDAAGLYPNLQKLKLLDVGTGTGILAIAAEHLGYGNVTAIDNDQDAVRVAMENMVVNGATRIEVTGKPISEFNQSFDLIVSNILLETHLMLAKDYRRLLIPGGLLILAGLLGGQTKQIESVLLPLGFVPQQKYLYQEWTATSYCLRSKS